MADDSRTILSEFGVDARKLWADVVDMLQTRRELAEVEMRADMRSIKRLLIRGGIRIAGPLTSLAMLAAGLAGRWAFPGTRGG